MRFALLATLALSLAPLPPARAETPSSPDREAAIEAWLANDEATALRALADLARAGDVPAALLLATLEMRGPETPYRAGLTAEEWRDLFRAPGSAFGKPWVDAVPKDAAPDLTRAFKALRARDWPEALTAALAAGDTALAARAARGFADHSPKLFMEFDRATPLPHELRPMLWLAAATMAGQVAGDRDMKRLLDELATEPESLGALAAASALPETPDADLQTVALGNLLRTGRAAPPPDFATLTEAAALIAAAPEGRTLAALCSESCPEDRDGCIVAGNTAVRGYLTLFTLDTPLATVIPSDRYHDSPRARSELLRLAMGSGALLSLLPETPGGACFAALIPRG
jgi:hypothetical protein